MHSVRYLISTLILFQALSPRPIPSDEAKTFNELLPGVPFYDAPSQSSTDRPEWDAASIAIAKVAVEYSAAAYEINRESTDWTCPRKCTALTEGTVLTDLLTEQIPIIDGLGYVARNDARKWIVVAFRGSVTAGNWVSNLAKVPVRWDDGVVGDPKGPLLVHVGFRDNWRALRPAMLEAIQRQLAEHPDYQIILTGHSLGATAALLSSAFFATWFPQHIPEFDVQKNVKVYTFGLPRVFNRNFADYYDTLGIEHNRFVHENDFATHLPPRLSALWWHTSGEKYEENGKVFVCEGQEDRECGRKRFWSGVSIDAHQIALGTCISGGCEPGASPTDV